MKWHGERTLLEVGVCERDLMFTSMALSKSSWIVVLSMYCTVVPPTDPLTTDMAELLLLPAFPTVGSMYASKATAAIAAAVLRYRVCSGGSGGILARSELEEGKKVQLPKAVTEQTYPITCSPEQISTRDNLQAHKILSNDLWERCGS
jgi:hypothetical protein